MRGEGKRRGKKRKGVKKRKEKPKSCIYDLKSKNKYKGKNEPSTFVIFKVQP